MKMSQKHEEDGEEIGTSNEPSTIDAARAAELIIDAEHLLARARELLAGVGGEVLSRRRLAEPDDGAGGLVIEGVFDGQKMIGPDGKHYAVPSNYASKSKLVEGDLLKLTITERGAFIYKQIGPIERRRLKGVLMRNVGGSFEWAARVGDKSYRVLTASVTYYRGHDGEAVAILVPENSESTWAAIENIIRKSDGDDFSGSDIE